MYAQATIIHVPEGGMPRLRQIIDTEYLPHVRERDGFIQATLLEQIDDPETGILIIYWKNQQAVEAFHATGMLHSAVQALAAWMPAIRVEREGYIVTVNVQGKTAAQISVAQV
jgi:heme-degrading monooxygenase HmoA